jgi:[ribosomal protein S18]-alanine N-acetyltransferase
LVNLHTSTKSDIELIYGIYQDEIDGTWLLPDFLIFQEKQANRLYSIFSKEKKLIGFVMATIVLDEINLLNIALQEECQGVGVGSAIFKILTTDWKQEGLLSLFLEVREGSLAEMFYLKRGCVKTGTRRSYYADGQSATLMTLTL